MAAAADPAKKLEGLLKEKWAPADAPEDAQPVRTLLLPHLLSSGTRRSCVLIALCLLAHVLQLSVLWLRYFEAGRDFEVSFPSIPSY